jgi:hypothetical protein
MDTITRAKNICLSPTTEWSVVAEENAATGALLTGYVIPLAAIGAVAGFVGGSLVGRTLPFVGGTYRVPIISGIVTACFALVMAVVGVLILSFIINALAPTFGGQKNSAQALKVAVYSYTPAWLAAIVLILPALSWVIMLAAAVYALYLLYLGLPRLMKCPTDKAVAYTAVVIVCTIVLSVVVAAIGGMIGVPLMMAGAAAGAPAGALGGAFGAPPAASAVQYDPNSTMGKLQALGAKMDESSKKMEAAEKRGDQGAQVNAAMEGLGALLGGGKRVDPIPIDQLKPFVPDTFAGLPKTSSNAEKTGIPGIMVSKAEATYGDGGKKDVTLEVSDTGGASGIMALAGWANVEGEKDNDDFSERTTKVNGRLTHERASKRGGRNEFAVVLGDRFVVSASGSGVDLNALKSAVSGLSLAQLESMKDAGVQK